ncbi:MAG: phage holin family protein [Verrucomicrobia bacterium]|nr:phage holin family protein [Verrucomicrobiota bacterium]MBV9644312.1 phage holin family protein [Verrucomicrobiota bacterium]
MDPDAPLGVQGAAQSTGDSVRNWVASFLTYLDLRLRLLGLESKEAGLHLLVLALLLVGALVFFAGFLVMLLVFFLYLLTLIFHWAWGWSALTCAGISLLIAIIVGIIFRLRIVKPVFPTTFAEFKRDREWLTHKTKEAE